VNRPSLAATVGRVAPWQILHRALTGLLPLWLAAWFGRSAETDLYNLLAALFTLAGSLVFASFQDSALIPIVIDLHRREPAQLPRFAGALYTYTLLLASALALLIGAGAWLWFHGHAGLAAPLVLPLTIGFALYLPLLALRSLAAALLAARFRFVPDACAGAAGGLVTLGIIAWPLARNRGLGVVPFALAAGELVAAMVLLRALGRAGVRVAPTLARTEPLRRFVRLVSSEIGGSVVVRFNPLVDQMVAGALGIAGGATMLRLSGDLASFPASLLSSTFLSVLLSHLAAAGADERRHDLQRTVTRSILAVAAVFGATTLILFRLRAPLVALVYGRGAMDPAALARMAHLLPFHLAGLVPFGIVLVLARAHVSMGNSRILVGMGALNAGANLILNLVLVGPLGLEGIALATSLVSGLVAWVFWIQLRSRLRKPAPHRATVVLPPAAPSEAAAPVVHVVVAGEIGGAERMVLALARPSAGDPDHPQLGTTRRHLIALWTEAPAVMALFAGSGIEVVHPPRRTGRHLPSLLPMGATGGPDVAWLAALLRTTGAGAVQLHTFASQVLGTRAGLRAGVPVIRTEHSTRVYDHWLCRPFSAWSLRRAAVVVAVSDYLRCQIVADLPALAARVEVIRNGVRYPPAPPAAPARRGRTPLRIGLVARLEPRKGVDRALAALARVAAPRSGIDVDLDVDLELDIVGDGPCRRALQRQAIALGLEGRVRFWGYRCDPETVIAQTDAVLCSSRTEGLSVALLEAMALGRPVIAVPVGGVPEIVADGHSGWLARDNSIDALAAALTAAAAAGPRERARRGAQARASVARSFTEAHMRAAYEAIYRAVSPARSTTTEIARTSRRAG
jgi:putative peptidoglycan lipid II flippase